MTTLDADLRKLAANTIRALAIDATNRANSGHPGAPMGLADAAVVLFGEVMSFDPEAPDWPNRDRFVLSNGHASMLIYSMLHLCGYDLSMAELKRFRQLESKTPGHPEYHLTPGIETTTGPLGQGFANAVGMAMATRMAKARFNQGGFDPITHRVYGILGDGCMMEGISHEAASVAGHLGLGELIFLYDDNSITIDGSTDISMTENVEQRFQAYGWHTLRVDGHDQAAIKEAVASAQGVLDRPSLILAKTHIGYGSPNRQDTPKAHGEPLGDEEAKLAKEKLGWTGGPFEVPDSVRGLFSAAAERGKQAHRTWQAGLGKWKEDNAALGASWDAHWNRTVPEDAWQDAAKALEGATGATRNMSGAAINALAKRVPALVGGSADLAGSTKNTMKDSGHVSRESFEGRNIHFGVREHAMAAMVNGMALYGAFIPFGATFLAFSDYMRPSIRLSALMRIRALEIFTHDSIGLGEDGPTHQAVEQLWALRLIPNLTVWRPADGLETAMAWSYAVGQGEDAPHSLVFTRQKVDPLDRTDGFDPKSIWKGGYVLQDRDGASVALIATGSEVGLAVRAAKLLEEKGVKARVVSMPAVERFLDQDAAYRADVLPPTMKKVSIEAGRSSPWAIITGADGLNLGVDTFGESAPYQEVYDYFGLTPEKVAKRIAEWL